MGGAVFGLGLECGNLRIFSLLWDVRAVLNFFDLGINIRWRVGHLGAQVPVTVATDEKDEYKA
ncbi:MAG TPA: hypothetical protein VK171_00500 [Fimbriimonas sp.]|nr:hypothetical protein [Fimbriimonas sp.]